VQDWCRGAGSCRGAFAVRGLVVRLQRGRTISAKLSIYSDPLQIISALHQRFPELFTPPFVASLLAALKPTISTAHSAAAADREIKEKEDSARVIKQRGLLRILGELEVVGIVSVAPKKGSEGGQTGEVCWGVLKELVSISSPMMYHPRR
jgi:hypothetical protein